VKIYLASPLGFAESTRAFMSELLVALREARHSVFDPWNHPEGDPFAHVREEPPELRLQDLREANFAVGRANEQGIRGCDAVLAVLDGVDVDSGTASEMGFGYGAGKRIYGLRTDTRLIGDNEAAVVNLQVEYWVRASGGQIFKSLAEVRIWAEDPTLT
jgi:nucleoside 2-deoxyribosyltransferase